MKHYHKEFKETQEKVYKKTNHFAHMTSFFVILFVLLILNLAAVVFTSSSWNIGHSILKKNLSVHLEEHKENLETFLQNEDYCGFSGYFNRNYGGLTLSFILITVTGINQIKDYDYEPSYYTEDYYLSYLEDEDYMSLLNMSIQDSKLGKSYSKTIQECKAVGKYIEAASLYKAFVSAADISSARTQIQRMEQYVAQTGELQEHIGKINKLLQIDEIGK